MYDWQDLERKLPEPPSLAWCIALLVIVLAIGAVTA